MPDTSFSLIPQSVLMYELITDQFKPRYLHPEHQRFSERISWILGTGMIYSICFVDPSTNKPDSSFASKVSEKCMQKGLLVVHTGRASIKLGAPLTITDEALLEGISVLSDSIAELA